MSGFTTAITQIGAGNKPHPVTLYAKVTRTCLLATHDTCQPSWLLCLLLASAVGCT